MGKLLILLVLVISLNVPAVELQPGKEFYTIQVASFKKKEIALKVLNRIKNLPYARITHQNGRFRVRVGFFKSLSEAEQFANTELKSKIGSFYITRTVFSSKDVIFASNLEKTNKREKTPEIGQKKPPQRTQTPETISKNTKKIEHKTQEKKEQKILSSFTKIEIKKSETLSKISHTNSTVAKTTNFIGIPKRKITEKQLKKFSKLQSNYSTNFKREIPKFNHQRKKNPVDKKKIPRRKKLFVLFPLAILLIVVLFLIKLFKKRKKDSEENLERFVSRLLEEGRCEEILETLLPLLTLQPDNTFIRKAVADCYVKSGKFLEAASIYEEIGEIFEKKGLQVLSDEFKQKAEELYEREFKGGKKPSR